MKICFILALILVSASQYHSARASALQETQHNYKRFPKPIITIIQSYLPYDARKN